MVTTGHAGCRLVGWKLVELVSPMTAMPTLQFLSVLLIFLTSLVLSGCIESGTTWFSRLFGFDELSGDAAAWLVTREHFAWDPATTILKSKANGRTFYAGHFSTPSLEDLRERVDMSRAKYSLQGGLRVSNLVGEVSEMHTMSDNAYALFQAASQFNTLEFVNPYVTPEDGITGYQRDHTQGPACATACAAGTVVRNYFSVDGHGQTAEHQINNLKDIEEQLNNTVHEYFTVEGGYTLASSKGMQRLSARLANDPVLADHVRAKLRIGVQSDTEVTGSDFGAKEYKGPELIVSQAFCSAAAIGYNRGARAEDWKRFALLILEATYEATLYVAVENALRNRGQPGAKKVFLTQVGGGVFDNSHEWIAAAMQRAFHKFHDVGLDIYIVSHGHHSQIALYE